MKRLVKIAALAALVFFVTSSSRIKINAQNASDSGQIILKNTAPEEFRPTPIMPQCFLGAMQRINRDTGGAVFLVRVDEKTGCVVPSHWHTSGEQIIVVHGIVNIRMSNGTSVELKEGGYAYLPPKHIHRFSCPGPCVHFVQSDGPYDIHYVNSDGDKISLAEAIRTDK